MLWIFKQSYSPWESYPMLWVEVKSVNEKFIKIEAELQISKTVITQLVQRILSLKRSC